MMHTKAKWFRYFSYLAGLITMSPIVQYFFPQQGLSLSQISLQDSAGLLFAQHWGFMAFCMGLLLIWAAQAPHQRKLPLVLIALEKFALVLLITLNWQTPALQGMHLAAFFDGTCVLIIGWMLIQIRGGQTPSH